MLVKQNNLVNYLSLFLMTIITVFSIINKQTTVFYILYLFWFDELIRTVFDRLKFYFRKNQIEDLSVFLSDNNNRFFMLSVYLVFILVFFGLMMDWKHYEIIGNNFSVFFFQNSLFNSSLITFLFREYYLFKNNKAQLESKTLLSNGIIILHLSLIFGIFFWFISTKKILFFQEYATLISIIPFLLLKIIFEIKSENQLV